MPSEDTPVKLLSSIEAYQWRVKQIENDLQTHVSHPLFTDEELCNLPYRRQHSPFITTRSTWPSTGGSTVINKPHCVVTSREIERGILQRELGLIEQDNQNTKHRAYKNQRMLLNINRALAVNMARI